MKKKAKTGRPKKEPWAAQKYTLGIRLSAIEHMLLSALLKKMREDDPLSGVSLTMTGIVRAAAVREAKKEGFDVVRGEDGKLSVTRGAVA
jgi:hypothetical protein